MKIIKLFILLLLISQYSCTPSIDETKLEYKKALVSYNDFEGLVKSVKKIRKKSLINLDQFLEYQRNSNTIVLDTRSQNNYNGSHIEGAINLPFTEFTQSNLKKLIPNTLTRVLIYCNNNFEGDEMFFASKVYSPSMIEKKSLLNEKKIIMLALNIPTYLNLYGYGYRNIFELDELVNINDTRLKLTSNNRISLFSTQGK